MVLFSFGLGRLLSSFLLFGLLLRFLLYHDSALKSELQ